MKYTRLFLLFAMFSVLLFFSQGCTEKKEPAPQTAFNEFNAAVNAKDWSKVWNFLSAKSKAAFSKEGLLRLKEFLGTIPPELREEKIEALNITTEELLKMSPEKFFMFMMEKNTNEYFQTVKPEDVISTEIKENVAKIKLKTNEYAIMVLEDNLWKVEFEDIEEN